MDIPIGILISGIIAWFGNKVVPAVWTHKLEMDKARLESAQYLCREKNDCRALNYFSMKGKLPKNFDSSLEQQPSAGEKSQPQESTSN